MLAVEEHGRLPSAAWGFPCTAWPQEEEERNFTSRIKPLRYLELNRSAVEPLLKDGLGPP
jgi:hypothetical protein